MALSGSKDYSATRLQLINAALRKIGEYDQGEAPSGDEVDAAQFALNLMLKEWVADGADLFLRSEVTLFLQKDQQSYALGTAHATTDFVETSLTSAIGISQVTIPVDSTGMTAADFVGIKMDDNSIHWTTIVSVDSGAQITIADGIDDTAASGNKVYAYTTKAGRPQKLLYAYRRDTSSNDTEVSLIGENEYQRQSNKGSSGPPVEIWYRPTLTTGTLKVWPVDGGKSFDKLVLISQYLPDDLDAQGDNAQFPIEWHNAIVWNLAFELAPEYGIGGRELRDLASVANNKLTKALDYDVENADVRFVMEA